VHCLLQTLDGQYPAAHSLVANPQVARGVSVCLGQHCPNFFSHVHSLEVIPKQFFCFLQYLQCLTSIAFTQLGHASGIHLRYLLHLLHHRFPLLLRTAFLSSSSSPPAASISAC